MSTSTDKPLTINKPNPKAVALLFHHYNLWLIEREMKNAPMRRAVRGKTVSTVTGKRSRTTA